jgi:hypothetical protein
MYGVTVTACGNPSKSAGTIASSDSVTIDVMGIRVAAACYRSPHSVLIGPPTPTGQQGKSPGWLALEKPQSADSGWAVMVDPDSKAFSALWRRDSTDSLVLRTGDDFLQIDMRLAVTDSRATGSALARSDAALEPDSTGRLGELRRQWTLHAVRASCDSMPPGWKP